MNGENQIDIEEISRRWSAEAQESDLGLWWLADDVREALGAGAVEDEVRALVLRALHPLLASGALRAADVRADGTFHLWAGDLREQLDRIARDWMRVGRPNIGDVAWFIGRR